VTRQGESLIPAKTCAVVSAGARDWCTLRVEAKKGSGLKAGLFAGFVGVLVSSQIDAFRQSRLKDQLEKGSGQSDNVFLDSLLRLTERHHWAVEWSG
jgi:hypothetical protein